MAAPGAVCLTQLGDGRTVKKTRKEVRGEKQPGVGWRKGRVEDVEDAGAEKEVEDEKAGGREERKRVCIHNE